jgi:hypothetical protein
VQVAQVVLRANDDPRILLFAREMVEVDHQLEVRVTDRLDELQSLGRGVDDAGLLPPERPDRDGDGVALR